MYLDPIDAFQNATRIASPGADRADGPAPGTGGILAGSLVETDAGWREVQTLSPGDRVQTFDGGLKPLCHVARRSLAPDTRLWRAEAGALDTCSPLVLLPDQFVLVESRRAEALFGTPLMLAPAAALGEGRGVLPVDPADGEAPCEAVTLHFEEEEIVYVNTGALLYCPGLSRGHGATLAEFFPVLGRREAAHLARAA